MRQSGLKYLFKRELQILTSRRVYLWAMLLIPVGVALFFVSLMWEGLPLKTPTAVVDLDGTSMSRRMIRSLKAQELTDITVNLGSYREAMDQVESGKIFGFFYIPRNFQKDALAGKKPTITYYSNMTYFVPGTLAFKGFKTIAVGTSANVVTAKLSAAGISGGTTEELIQPVAADIHPLNNPWTNYSIYLCNSFVPGALELMIFLVTCFSLCQEIKTKRSIEWLRAANGSITKALIGKLLPQTIIFFIIGVFIEVLFYKFLHFPMNGSWWAMIGAMFLFVVASQSFATIICCAVPNLRLSLSLCSLAGILAFSLTGFSFPVQSMYGWLASLSYIIPVRYYFLIYTDIALNGIPVYFARWYFVALLLFPLAIGTVAWNMKRYMAKPVYVP